MWGLREAPERAKGGLCPEKPERLSYSGSALVAVVEATKLELGHDPLLGDLDVDRTPVLGPGPRPALSRLGAEPKEAAADQPGSRQHTRERETDRGDQE